ncbi:MAG: hypothetical protein RLZZ429_771 [Bacteroidota bacterium]
MGDEEMNFMGGWRRVATEGTEFFLCFSVSSVAIKNYL